MFWSYALKSDNKNQPGGRFLLVDIIRIYRHMVFTDSTYLTGVQQHEREHCR